MVLTMMFHRDCNQLQASFQTCAPAMHEHGCDDVNTDERSMNPQVRG